LNEPRERGNGLRVLEVKADRSSLRALHAAIKAAL
jgi:2-succinyl-5-enolpyruvyl-6-hydroxy-3-cyclohexene-1-carboxylate synthase